VCKVGPRNHSPIMFMILIIKRERYADMERERETDRERERDIL